MNHYLWTNDIEALKETQEWARDLNITLRNYAELELDNPDFKAIMAELIAQGKYVMASDLFRLAVLYVEGGIYLDID